MVDEIDQKKEEVKQFIKNHSQLLIYIILAIIILVGFTARLGNIELLKDITTGKYITLELDSAIFLRYAEYIAKNGALYTLDKMRFAPLGGDISSLGVGLSYFVAYLYNFLHFFNPNITIEYADLLYPPLTMAIMSIFLFLLVKRLFNWKVGLLSVILIQFIPSFLFRSISSDHDMLAMMFWIITFYLYITSWQSKNIKIKIVLAVLAGITTILTEKIAGMDNFIFLILGAFSIIEIILNKFSNEDFYTYSIWLIVATVCIIFQDGIQTFIGKITSLTGIISYIGLISGMIYFIFNKNLFNLKQKFEKIKLPEGLISLLITIVLGSILVFIFLGSDFFVNMAQALGKMLFHAFKVSRWTMTVAENKVPYVQEWFGQLGKVIFYSMIAGSILLFYKAVKNIDKKKYLTLSYAIFIFIYIFSKYSSTSMFNGESFISRLFFYGSLLGFFGVFIYSYLNIYYKNKETYNQIKDINPKYSFILIWFILMVIAATSAIRLTYEFTPIVVILSAFFFGEMFDYFNTNSRNYIKYLIIGVIALLMFFNSMILIPVIILVLLIISYFYDIETIKTKQTPTIKYLGLILLALILFSPFSFALGVVYQDYQNASNQIKYMGPGYNQQWQVAGKWVRENTNKATTVFAHWWDYGYWVQSGFDRTTILDGGNFIGWWNYLMGRKVLTGQTQEEALPYLYSHGATHLLIVADEIGKYSAYSIIGSDEKFDRYSYITTFALNPQLTKETRNGTTLYYQGGFALDENFIFNNQIYPAGQAGIMSIKVPIINGNINPEPKQPSIVLAYQNQIHELTLKCIFFNNRLYEFENAEYDGCFRVVPVISSQTDINGIGAGYLLSRRTYHSNFGQLYMLNKQSDYFKVVYDDSQNFPLAIYQGRQIGPTKIWSITYPKNISLTKEELDYNLRITYANEELTKPQ